MLVSTDSFGQQISTYQIGTTDLFCADSPDEQAICVGGAGGIWRSSDAGVSWTQRVVVSELVGEMKFFGQTGYATSVNGGPQYNIDVLKTVNGGLNWAVCYTTPDSIRFSRLFVKSENEIFTNFAGAPWGRPSQLYRSTDGGITWNVVFEVYIYAFQGVTGDNEENIFVNGSQYFSSEDLVNWVWHISPVSFPFSNTTYANNRLYVGGDIFQSNSFYPLVAYSTNKGETWTNYVFPDSGQCNNMDFASNGKGYVVGSTRYTNYDWLAETTDQGNTWNRVYGSPLVRIRNVSATTRYVYAVGSSSNNIGTVVRYEAMVTSIHPNSISTGYLLSQNYPNPFNPTTKISYSVPVSGVVSLTVFDVSGREVKKLVNENKPTGNYSVEFNASTLTTGTYFYRLQAGEFTETKKMVLIK